MTRYESEMLKYEGAPLLKIVCPKCGTILGFAQESKRTFIQCKKCGAEVIFSVKGENSEVNFIDRDDYCLLRTVPDITNLKIG